jgi:hypothetical protein
LLPPRLQNFYISQPGSVAAAISSIANSSPHAPGVGFLSNTELEHLYQVDGITATSPGLFKNIASPMVPGHTKLVGITYWESAQYSF